MSSLYSVNLTTPKNNIRFWNGIQNEKWNTKYQIEEMQLAEVHKYKWQNYSSSSDFWSMGDFWISQCLYHESASISIPWEMMLLDIQKYKKKQE